VPFLNTLPPKADAKVETTNSKTKCETKIFENTLLFSFCALKAQSLQAVFFGNGLQR
jgi:hypothetical protein